ncbi:MAG TPA: helicase-related protein [Chloroflexia bacterium]|nr:helicase-related protein [Chloroflexia bacterium]
MVILEQITVGARLRGLLPDQIVSVVAAKWFGSTAMELHYKIEETGAVGTQLLLRSDQERLELMAEGSQWSFDAEGGLFRLAMEAYRLNLAFLFDPLLAMSVSQVEALPHQLSAVYEEMLPRQPLRFLLADDPGAGKTIMAGLFIKELILRGDLERCLVVAPANLSQQWQEELDQKFKLNFKIVGRSEIEQSLTNPFEEYPLAISRIDLLKQDENLERLRQVEWDLVVVDEAHKMSASYDPSGDKRETARYKLGKLLGEHSRHFLLMTATPHRGKEADFQLFMALLDSDRFEGRYREGVHNSDVEGLMRRLLKEELVGFNSQPLFPERRAYTVKYDLSEDENRLYQAVTKYVNEEMNRAEEVAKEEGGEGNKRRAVVGFALTTLQRRLASSPNAIYQSISRRRRRLELTLEEEKLKKQELEHERLQLLAGVRLRTTDPDELDEDLEERPEEEVEQIVDQASAARSVGELEHEIGELRKLEKLAKAVHDSDHDSKWVELRRLLGGQQEMFDQHGRRLKLVLFTEHRDTLDYLANKIRSFLGNPEAVVTIHGSLSRENRQEAQSKFVNDKDALVLVATDAAGEGINLQKANLMVNYDLPWNPNRLEQRFGRIHRFGQTEVCHCWNLLAHQTREGSVFQTLLEKLEIERQALGGKVFDVLGDLFKQESLRDLLLEAIRYGDDPARKEELSQRLSQTIDRDHFDQLLQERALNTEQFGLARLQAVKDMLQRAEVNRVVPYFIASFFQEAFSHLGGSIHKRESGRYEVTNVPMELRRRGRVQGQYAPLLRRYERVCFDKKLVSVDKKPLAEFVAPGHPLLNSVIDVTLERYKALMRQGAILVDPRPEADRVRAMFCLRQDITDGLPGPKGERRVVSSELHFIELDADGHVTGTLQGPYLDYKPLAEEQQEAALEICRQWTGQDLENLALGYAIEHLVPSHVQKMRETREQLVLKTMQAVQERLTKEITFWDQRAEQLKEQELAGKQPRRNSGWAREKAETLEVRLKKRMSELALERQLAPQPPVVVAAALVIPASLLPVARQEQDGEEFADEFSLDPEARRRIELAAMEAVMRYERELKNIPQDVSERDLGYDIESRDPRNGTLRFIEVKGRHAKAKTVTITHNECKAGLNARSNYILALVKVDEDGQTQQPLYVYDPIPHILPGEPAFAMVSVNASLKLLLEQAI